MNTNEHETLILVKSIADALNRIAFHLATTNKKLDDLNLLSERIAILLEHSRE